MLYSSMYVKILGLPSAGYIHSLGFLQYREKEKPLVKFVAIQSGRMTKCLGLLTEK